jgi:hypothetical protein
MERTKGKLRPSLPRSSDLAVVRAVGEPLGNRDARGRFASGNEIGRGRGWRNLIRKSLGTEASTPLVERLVRETLVLHAGFMRELPFQGLQVNAPTAARAKWVAISAHVVNRALELGIETDKGRELLELALRLDQRAERLAVTALDMATRLAAAKPARRQGPSIWEASADDEDDDDDAKPAGGDEDALASHDGAGIGDEHNA